MGDMMALIIRTNRAEEDAGHDESYSGTDKPFLLDKPIPVGVAVVSKWAIHRAL